jgi:PTS system mannose-specific IIB component
MMLPALVRIDDRLIHGQITLLWVTALDATRILIVDDRVAADPFMQDILRLAAPGVTVNVTTVADALKHLGSEAAKTIVLVKSPRTALELWEHGVPFTALNVGGLGAGPGRKLLYRNISASADDLAALRELALKGVDIAIQVIPDDKPVSLTALAKKRQT